MPTKHTCPECETRVYDHEDDWIEEWEAREDGREDLVVRHRPCGTELDRFVPLEGES